MAGKTFRVGVIGYGGAFNMGKTHLNSLLLNKGFEAAAVCDMDPKRVKVAEEDFPGIATFTSVDKMLKTADLDLVIIITPHNTHGPLVVQCLNAGKHVVCEKPLAITSDEVKAMIAAAKRSKTVFSTFHNRRWDGDFQTLVNIIVKDKMIGRVFRIEAGHSNYREQGTWWRAYRKISGGAIYDWGAHFTDWILNLVPNKIDHVTGFQVKNPKWKKYDNEDHSECTITFDGGCTSTLTISNLSMEGKPRWRILGEQGSVVDAGGHFLVKSLVKGYQVEAKVPYLQSDWNAYYKNVAEHLTKKKPLVITPESAARVIGVLDAANQSAAKGGQPVAPFMK